MEANADRPHPDPGTDERGLVFTRRAVALEYGTKLKGGDRIAFLMSLINVAASSTTSSGSGGSIDGSSGGGGWSLPDWSIILGPLPKILADAGEKMDRVTTTVSDVMSGKFLKDSIENLFILWSDEAVSPAMTVFQKVYLFTPRIAEIGFVQTLWSVVTILCAIMLFVGTGILANQVIRGKKEMGKLLTGFVVSLAATLLSLTILNIVNVLINWLTQMAVEGIIGTDGIDYTTLSGEDILKALVVGSDVLTDPTYAGQTLGETLSASGGIFALLLHMHAVIPQLYITSVIKILVLMSMAIGAGFWIAYVAFTGKLEVLVGYLNIYVRTLLVGTVLTLHWAMFVKAQTDYGAGEGIWAEIGIHPVIAAPISVMTLFVILFFLWIRPIYRAMRDPLTLNGGQAVETAGKWSERASTALSAVGKRLGSEGLQMRSLSFAAKAKRMQEAGQRMQQSRSQLGKRMVSRMTGGASEALQGVRYEPPKDWAVQSGDVITVETAPVSYAGAHIHAEPHEIAHTLKSEGFEGGSLVSIPEKERADLKKMLAVPDFKRKYGASLTYKAATGELLLTGSKGTAALQELRESQFNVSSMVSGHAKDGVFVGTNGKVKSVGSGAAAEEAMQTVKEQLSAYQKASLAPADAAAAHRQLTDNRSRYPWVDRLKLKKDGLWVPDDLLPTVTPVLEGMQKHGVQRVRLAMPKGSKFLGRMLADWKDSGKHADLLAAVVGDEKANVVMVNQEKLGAFQVAYESYRKDRIPFWRTSRKKVKVILDGQPVDYGQPPLNGLDMGSFEDFQKETLRKHQG